MCVSCTSTCLSVHIRRWKTIETEVHKSQKFPRWKKFVKSIIPQVINFSQKTIRIFSIIHNCILLSISQAHLHSEILNKLVDTIWGYNDFYFFWFLSEKKWVNGILFVLILKASLIISFLTNESVPVAIVHFCYEQGSPIIDFDPPYTSPSALDVQF